MLIIRSQKSVNYLLLFAYLLYVSAFSETSRCCARIAHISAPHAGRLDRQPLSAPSEEELEFEVFLRAVRQHLGADPREAGAEATFQRPHGLPLHAIRRVGVGMALADGLGEQPLPPLRVVTVRAREVHLSAP